MNEKSLTGESLQQIENILPVEFAKQYGRIMQAIMNTESNSDIASFGYSIGTLFLKAAISSYAEPEKLTANYSTFIQKQLALSHYVFQKAQGNHDYPVVAAPGKGDSRFRADAWRENLWFDAMKQSYLIGSDFLDEFFSSTAHLSKQEAKKLTFYKHQWINSLAPTNYWWMNPDVLKVTQQTNGQNLVEGMKMFANDLEAGTGVQMVDQDAFEIGQNIAATPGKIVARNRLCELIQYKATTEQVREIPILIIPPWINKYYILDLSPKNSLIGWLVAQGYSIFVISWINPDESYRDTSYDDYLEQGPMFAAKVVQEITSQKNMNVVGYCLGGTLLATLLGYLEKSDQSENFVHSATFLTTMIDFSEPGDLGVFVDEQSVSQLERKMSETGYLEGKSMASTFNMMRSNDLIWHFVINNYLLGKKPGKFDLLYWNSDSTRMPANMHSFYLRKMYIENLLSKTDGLSVLGCSIDLTKVQTPAFFVSTQMDHIAPWPSTYLGAKIFGGKVRFLLGESGHIAGVINPPHKNKYSYWTSKQPLPESSENWFEQATRYEGSWWPEWESWLKKRSGDLIESREIGSQDYPPLTDAPGDYVKL